MTLKSIFKKAVDRPIEGVIKADDDVSLYVELDEYVVTNEVSKCLNDFIGAYLNIIDNIIAPIFLVIDEQPDSVAQEIDPTDFHTVDRQSCSLLKIFHKFGPFIRPYQINFFIVNQSTVFLHNFF